MLDRNKNHIANKTSDKLLKNNETIQALNILIKDVAKKYNTTSEKIIDALNEKIKDDEFAKKNQLVQIHLGEENITTESDKNQLRGEIPEEEIKDSYTIPTSLFSENPKEKGYLELIIAYSKEVLGLRFNKIAEILNRDQRTIWASYSNYKKKNPKSSLEKHKQKRESGSEDILLAIFSDREYSTFENLLLELSKTRTTKEIAALLERDYKTIWTVLSRARRKAR